MDEIENLTIIENDEDESLISIPSLPIRKRYVCKYWVEVFIGAGILALCLTIVTIVFLVIFSYVSEASTSNLIKQCKTDKLCSIDNSETQALLTVFESDSFWADVSNSYSFVYTALSNKTTFTFAGQKGRTLKVNTISIHDTSNNQTLIKSGDLKNDSFNAYCLCNDSTSYGSQYYAFEFQTLFSQIIVSQSVQIVPGRQYNVTFWVDRAISWNLKNRFIVRRSSASKMTVFSFFFVFLHLF